MMLTTITVQSLRAWFSTTFAYLQTNLSQNKTQHLPQRQMAHNQHTFQLSKPPQLSDPPL
jgi:hypothetical protein